MLDKTQPCCACKKSNWQEKEKLVLLETLTLVTQVQSRGAAGSQVGECYDSGQVRDGGYFFLVSFKQGNSKCVYFMGEKDLFHGTV